MHLAETDNQSKIAELAKQFDIEHPLMQESQAESESTQWIDDENQTQSIEAIEDSQTVLQDFNAERSTVNWKSSSYTRMGIIGGGFFLVALAVVAMFNLRMPEIGIQAVRQNSDSTEEEIAFAEDGEFAAEAAYASQNQAFESLEKQRMAPTHKGKPPAQPNAASSQAAAPRRVAPPNTSVSYSRPITPPPSSVVPVSRSLTRPTVPYNSFASKPEPSSRQKTPAPQPPPVVAAAPKPAQPLISPSVKSEKKDPMEQWMMASMSGVSIDNLESAEAPTPAVASSSQPGQYVPASFNEFEDPLVPQDQSVFGVPIEIGTKMTGKLVTPISFSENIKDSQQVLIQLDPSDILPNGGQMMAQYEPASQSQSRDVVVDLKAIAMIVDGYEIPITSNNILISSKQGKGLIAKQQKSGGGVGQILGSIALGGMREGMGLLNRPTSSSSSVNQFGSSQSTTYDDPNILAGLGYGIADNGLEMIEGQMGEPTLNGVWTIKPGQDLEIYFVQETVI